MKTFEQMLKRLQKEKHIIVSLLFVEQFVNYCNERGVVVNGGAFVDGEYAQVLYI